MSNEETLREREHCELTTHLASLYSPIAPMCPIEGAIDAFPTFLDHRSGVYHMNMPFTDPNSQSPKEHSVCLLPLIYH